MGIMAACTPLMKPFFRYIKARLTGKDPRLLRSQSPKERSYHSSWFSRLLRSHSRKGKQLHGLHSPQGQETFLESETKDTSYGTNVTLDLPMQGAHSSVDEESIPRRDEKKGSEGSLQTHLGEPKDVEDRV